MPTSSQLDALVAATNPAMLVVTASVDDTSDGCLVGFHSQCSIEPERYAVWLSRANLTYRLALFASHLGVHFLSAADRDLAKLFGANSGDDTDKLGRCKWHRDPNGVVLLDQLANRFVGQRHALVDTGGDHVCFVLEPVSAGGSGPSTPLRLDDVSGLTPGHEADDR